MSQQFDYCTTYLVQLHSTGTTLPDSPEDGDAALQKIAAAIESGTAQCRLEGIEEFYPNGESRGGIFREEVSEDFDADDEWKVVRE